jgi:hypothetical protein
MRKEGIVLAHWFKHLLIQPINLLPFTRMGVARIVFNPMVEI